jgi:hypothetical protein
MRLIIPENADLHNMILDHPAGNNYIKEMFAIAFAPPKGRVSPV